MKMIHNQIEQVKIETLIQMARNSLKKELKGKSEIPPNTFYQFPDGTVDISITRLDEGTLKLIFTIRTKKEDIIYKNSNILRITN